MSSFIPEFDTQTTAVPFFEDNPIAKIPGRRTEKSPETLQREIVKLLQQLGAHSIYFVPGKFDGDPARYGYRIHFGYASAQGRYDVAALPMRSEAPGKKGKALAQCLYLVRNKLEAMVYAHIYEPESIPLLPYLISNTGLTVTEALRKGGNVPLLGSPDGGSER